MVSSPGEGSWYWTTSWRGRGWTTSFTAVQTVDSRIKRSASHSRGHCGSQRVVEGYMALVIWSLCVVVPSEALRTEEADLYDRGLWVTPAFQYARGSHQTDHYQSQGQSTPRSRSSNSAFSLALPSSSLKCAVAVIYRKISLHIQCFVKDFCVYVCNYR